MDTQEKSLYSSLLIVVIVVGIILLYFIITIIRYQRRSLVLHKEKIRAEIDTLENERKRIASDLHDELGPLLSAVKLQINNLNSQDSEDKVLIEKSSRHIDTIIKRLREISNNLMPNTLVRKGLIKAIEEFVQSNTDTYKLSVKLIIDAEFDLDLNKEINIYRIVQEIVHNTVKHAEASMLAIRISRENNLFVLTTTDNGMGFDFFARTKEQSGLGLRNLQSRAEIMGGEISCMSEKGKGTSYILEIPVSN
ncbi:ATP-binding protein [Terrimonas sp. NA20]|uniref:Oxygen sensor histidine kinase NreB n=1 Tax=Terrimonas ginsenosidimutans TaxID=2908004 RepID=A0ABS9KNR9_9BACT|nr:ATP-binding protein [Terrimonas ginsenosidimutans]MCG2613951.1 ATP-binding protein [Terrimonas ginsenosidimutans]